MPWNEKLADDFLDTRYGDDAASDVRQSVIEGIDSNPDEAAKALRYSHERGIPLDMAQRNLQELEKEDVFHSIDFGRMQKSPYLMDFLRDRDNARLAHDDIGLLMESGDFFRSFAGGAVSTIGQTFSGAGRGLSRLADYAAEGAVEGEAHGLGKPGILDAMAIGTTSLLGDILKTSGGSYKTVGKAINPPDERLGFMDFLANGLGQAGIQIGAAIMSGGTAGGAGLAGLQMADVGYDEAEKQGKTGWQADATAALYGGATALTEKYGLDFLMKGIPEPIKRATIGRIAGWAAKLGLEPDGLVADAAVKVADTAFRGASEATQEATEQLLQNLVDKTVLGEDKPITDQVGINASVGGGVGSIIGAIVNGMLRTHTGFSIEKEKSVVEEMKQSREMTQAPKLFGRSRAKMNEYIRSATGEQDLYINPAAVNTFYQGLSPEGREQLNADMPDFESRLNESLVENADFTVPRADYHTYVQPLDEKAHLDNFVRFVPEDSSPGDRAEYDAHIAELYDLTEGKQGAEDGEVVQENFYAQLMQRFGQRQAASGKVDVARLLSENPRAFYETVLSRSGGDEKVKGILDRMIKNVTVNRVIPNLGAFLKKDDFDLQIDKARNRAESRAKASQKAKSGKTDLFGQRNAGKKREKAGPTPIINYLASKGGVKRGSNLAQELATLDVTPKSHPRLFNEKTGQTDFDNIPHDEFQNDVGNDLLVQAKDDGNGYVDPQWFVDQVRNETFGQGAQNEDQRGKAQDDEYLDQIEQAIHASGLDLGASNAEIKNALQREYDAQQQIIASGKTLNQNDDETMPRGSISFMPDGTAVINLFEKENLSTVLHELGHLYWKAMTEVAALPAANAQIVADVAAMREKVGAKEGAELTVAQEEQIADSFLNYLRTGEAPSADLQSAFSRFKGWLVRIYRGVRDTLPKIDPEVKAIFDRMLATDEAIEALSRKPEFSIDQAIMNLLTKADSTRMQKKYEKMVAQAKDRLFRESMKQSERKNTKEYREAREIVRKDTAERVDALKAYTTIDAIKRAGGLSRKLLIKNHGKEIIPYLSGHGGIVASKGGADPAAIAAMAGYPNERAMIQELMNTKPKKVRIEEDTDAEMLHRYGDMMNDGTIEREAVEAFHSALRAEIMQMEVDILAELAGIPAPTKEGIKGRAIEIMAAKKVREISPSRHLRAENKAYFDYGKALGKKEYALAARAKAQQLLNHHLYRMSLEARDTVDKRLQSWRRILSKSDKDIGKAKRLDIDYVYAARSILSKHGIGREDYDFASWHRMLSAENPDLAEALSFAIAMNSEQAKPYKDMEWADFLALGDAIDNLIEVGKGQRYITVEGKKMEISEAAGQLSAQALTKKRTGISSGFAGKLTDREINKINLYGVKAKWRRVESWVNGMDGGDYSGPFRKLIWNRVSDAANAYYSDRKVWLRKMVELLEPHKERLHGEKIMAPELVSEKTGEFYTFEDKGELLGMLLHTGNESNLYKLLAGYGWDADSFDAFLQRMYDEGTVTKQDWSLVQSLWDLTEELKPAVWRAHKEMYGFRPPEITANEVATPFGNFRGGYWPAIADRTKSDKAALRADKETIAKQDNFTAFPSTGRGATKARVENYAEPLEMSMRLLPSHIDWALRFTHIEPAVKDVGKIMLNEDFRATMKEIDPAVIQEMLVPWLQRTARQTLDMPKPGKGWKWINERAAWLRVQAGLQIMTGNIVNAAQQITGFAPVMYKVGPRNFAKAFLMYTSDMQGQATRIADLSAAMRHRQTIIDQNYMQKINAILQKRTTRQKVADFSGDYGYIAQHVAQKLVDNVGWIAAYNQALDGEAKGIDAGDDAKAIQYADSVVRETQGSMNPEDVSDIEAQTALGRLFTIFYSYFSAQGNLLVTEGQNILNAKTGPTAKAASLFYLYTMVYLIPSFIADAISASLRGRLPEDDDEDGSAMDEWFQFFLISQARYAAAMVPYVGQAANMTIGQFTKQQYDDHITLSPAVGLVETIGRTPKSVINAMFNDGDWSDAAGDLMTTAGALTGLPLGFVKRPVQYLVNVAEGDEEPGGLPSTIRGVIGGPGKKRE